MVCLVNECMPSSSIEATNNKVSELIGDHSEDSVKYFLIYQPKLNSHDGECTLKVMNYC